MASTSSYSNRFTWVTASIKDLHALALERGDKDTISPFWNIFAPDPIILGGLSFNEARETIRKPALSQKVTLSTKEVLEIYRISGKLPYFIQAVSKEWFRAKLQKKPFYEISRQTIENLSNLEQMQKLMEGYVQWMTVEQLILGHRLANLTPSKMIGQGATQLCNFGLIEETENGWGISGELLRQFMLTHKLKTKDQAIEAIDSPADGQRGPSVYINVYDGGTINQLNPFSEVRNADLDEIFRKLDQKAESLPAGEARNQVEEALKGLKSEASKGQKADEEKIQKWFKFLAKMAPDIFEVAVASFINPIQGLSTAFKKIADRARQSTQG